MRNSVVLLRASCAACTKQLDVVFVLDGSGSLEDSFEISLNLTKLIVEGLNFAGGRSRVGVLTFSDQPFVGFYLNRYPDSTSVLNAIAFSQVIGYTNTQAALDQLRLSMFTASNGDRQGVDNIAIVITDGNSNVNADQTIPKAQLAQQSGITIIGVGIEDQDGMNLMEIEGISSQPPSRYSFAMIDTSDTGVMSTANSILDLICQ